MSDIHLIKIKDAAAAMVEAGADVSYNMVWSRCNAGDIDAVKIDCHYFFTQDQYAKALEFFNNRKRMVRKKGKS